MAEVVLEISGGRGAQGPAGPTGPAGPVGPAAPGIWQSSATAGLQLVANSYNEFNGSAPTTWHLATPSTQLYRTEVKNAGTADLTLDVTGGANIFDATAVGSVVLHPGEARVFVDTSTRYNMQ